MHQHFLSLKTNSIFRWNANVFSYVKLSVLVAPLTPQKIDGATNLGIGIAARKSFLVYTPMIIPTSHQNNTFKKTAKINWFLLHLIFSFLGNRQPQSMSYALLGALVVSSFFAGAVSAQSGDAVSVTIVSNGPPAASSPLSQSYIVQKIHLAASRKQDIVVSLQLGMSPSDWSLLLRALIEAESNYDPKAVSRAGALGLGQLMPATAKSLGVDPHVPDQNLKGAATYLARNLAAFRSVNNALAAYNAGPGAVAKYNGVPPFAETRSYINRIHRIYARLGGTPLPSLHPVATITKTTRTPTRVVMKMEF